MYLKHKTSITLIIIGIILILFGTYYELIVKEYYLVIMNEIMITFKNLSYLEWGVIFIFLAVCIFGIETTSINVKIEDKNVNTKLDT